MMKRTYIALILVLAPTLASAAPLRLISVAGLETWGQVLAGELTRSSLSIEETALVRVDPALTLVARAKFSSPSSSLPKGGMGGGASLVLAPGLYADLVYNGSWDAESALFSNAVESSLNFETASYYLGLREKVQFDATGWILTNNLSAKYYPFGFLALWASYFLVYRPEAGFDQAVWSYVELSSLSFLSFSLGGTAGTFNPTTGTGAGTEGLGYTAIAGLTFRPIETIALKYQLEYSLGGQDSGKMAHTLIADTAF
jgi:hypothetical protein